jgi:hypothetical protein
MFPCLYGTGHTYPYGGKLRSRLLETKQLILMGKERKHSRKRGKNVANSSQLSGGEIGGKATIKIVWTIGK